MKEKLTTQEYEEIKHLVDYTLAAPNKKEAKRYINQLKSYGYSLCGRANNILSELISYAESASGRVKDKEHWIDCVQNRLYVLECYGVETQDM